MPKRFASIWFPFLLTDRIIKKQPELGDTPFVLAAPQRGRMIITAASAAAQAKDIRAGMTVADCRAILPGLQVMDDQPGQALQLLHAIAEWSLRYTPVAAIDLPEGLILDISGCAHLWGGEAAYLDDLLTRLKKHGYEARGAIADTIGAAWAVCRFGRLSSSVINPGAQANALQDLPAAALRLEPATTERLQKLGLHKIGSFMAMPGAALRRRFGESLLSRLAQALGQEAEELRPIRPVEPYQDRLPSLEPIRTATGIEIALRRLLASICTRLTREGKGLRTAIFKAWRVDGQVQQIGVGTIRPSRNIDHLFRLFEIKIQTLQPGLGFELFLLEAPVVEDMPPEQDSLWKTGTRGDDEAVAELLDRIVGKVGLDVIHRYLPDEHYWPERSVRSVTSLQEKPATAWRTDLPRPVHLLPQPEPIEVAVALPDYPPMLFLYKGKRHSIDKADGPERIEQEWWTAAGLYRDYYCVEDADGARYWVFREGPYDGREPKWFLHGFFA